MGLFGLPLHVGYACFYMEQKNKTGRHDYNIFKLITESPIVQAS